MVHRALGRAMYGWVRCKTRGAVADPLRRLGGASLNVNDEYLALSGDQYRH